jgi:hypothetical protein
MPCAVSMKREVRIPLWLVGCIVISFVVWEFFATNLLQSIEILPKRLPLPIQDKRTKWNPNLEQVLADYTNLHNK